MKRISIKLLTTTAATFALFALAIMAMPATSFVDSHPVVAALDNPDVTEAGQTAVLKVAILPSRVSCGPVPDILANGRTPVERSAKLNSESQIVGGAYKRIDPGRRNA